MSRPARWKQYGSAWLPRSAWRARDVFAEYGLRLVGGEGIFAVDLRRDRDGLVQLALRRLHGEGLRGQVELGSWEPAKARLRPERDEDTW